MKRKGTPNLDDLLNPATAQSLTPPKVESVPKVEKSIKKQKYQSAKIDEAKTSKQHISAYLSTDLILDLDAAQVSIKRLTGLKGHAVSRSALIEAALKMALNDLDAHQGNSVFISMMQ